MCSAQYCVPWLRGLHASPKRKGYISVLCYKSDESILLFTIQKLTNIGLPATNQQRGTIENYIKVNVESLVSKHWLVSRVGAMLIKLLNREQKYSLSTL